MEKILERTENMTLEELKAAKSAIEKIISARENENRKRLQENAIKALEAYHKEFPYDSWSISVRDADGYIVEVDIMDYIQELKEDI